MAGRAVSGAQEIRRPPAGVGNVVLMVGAVEVLPIPAAESPLAL
jgi:hypothetical protein